MNNIYTVRYGIISEDEYLYPSATIMSIDFDNKKNAMNFYNTIKNGNDFGTGYKLQIMKHKKSETELLQEFEF